MTLRVLVVCTANRCRSPYVAGLMRHLAGDGLEIRSGASSSPANRFRARASTWPRRRASTSRSIAATPYRRRTRRGPTSSLR